MLENQESSKNSKENNIWTLPQKESKIKKAQNSKQKAIKSITESLDPKFPEEFLQFAKWLKCQVSNLKKKQ